MKIRLKNFLNKHKRIFVNLTVTICLIPCFCVNAFAAEVSPDAQNEWFLLPFNSMTVGSGYQDFTFDDVGGTYNGTYNGSISSSSAGFCVNDIGAVMPLLAVDHNYYIFHTFSYQTSSYVGLNRIVVRSDITTSSNSFSLVPVYYSSSYVNDTVTGVGIHSYSPTSDRMLSTSSYIYYEFNESIIVNGRVSFSWYIVDVTDSTQEQIDSLISAINNQTDVISGKIDDTNNFIDKGNSGTGGIVSDFQDKDNELNEVVSEYQAVEQQFFDDFTANQDAITSDIVGWSWGGLVNCANWVGETMTDYYNNMGDFRQYIIYPLMLGIALFFLGRGSSIIGHLYRKPTTSVVDTQSVSTRRGNTRYTRTTTHREGGVKRK